MSVESLKELCLKTTINILKNKIEHNPKNICSEIIRLDLPILLEHFITRYRHEPPMSTLFLTSCFILIDDSKIRRVCLLFWLHVVVNDLPRGLKEMIQEESINSIETAMTNSFYQNCCRLS